MAEIKLIRADYRLIHGQIVAKWLKACHADKIVIINDELSKDEFLGDVYKMAAPQDIKVRIYGIDTGIEKWNQNQFGNGNVLLLFKCLQDARSFQKRGFPINSFQIGGLGSGSGKTVTSTGISFNAEDVSILQDMQKEGTQVYLQVVPDEQKVSIDDVVKKYTFK